MSEADHIGVLQVDHLSTMPLPHMSFMMRHFLPMAYSMTDKGSVGQSFAESKLDTQDVQYITSGSSREGISLPPLYKRSPSGSMHKEIVLSDADIMVVRTGRNVGEKTDANEPQISFCIHNAHVHPGYTLLKIINPEKISRELRTQLPGSDDWFLISHKFTSSLENHPNLDWDIKGPSINISLQQNTHKEFERLQVREEADIVHGIYVPKWPSFAQEWVSRKRLSTWPPSYLINDIVSKGCHVVGTGHSQSAHKDLEWRLSFSQAEILLISSLTRTQKQCYLLFKSLHYCFFKEPKGVATYHLKTILLWVAEEIPQNCWRQDNVGSMVTLLLDKLLHFLIRGELPSYFIPKNNLIDAVPKEVIRVIKQKVSRVRKDPIEHLLKFNDTYKYFFGPLFVNMRLIYFPVLLDCSLRKSFKEAIQNIYIPIAHALAFIHITDLRLLRTLDMGVTENPAGYTIPYDNALEICIDMARMAEMFSNQKSHPAEVALQFASNISGMMNDKSVPSLFCKRIIERFPEAPNMDKLMEFITRKV